MKIMSPSPEELLQEAIQSHGRSDFKKCFKAAEKARKQFLKQGDTARAIEALRVMADCTLNNREYMKARKLYEELLKEASQKASGFYQAAAHWGFGQIAMHQMDYRTAADAFKTGLTFARNISDNWYTGWNSFSLGNAQRGMGQLDDARTNLQEAVNAFTAMNQSTYAQWAKRVLDEIGGAPERPPEEAKVWLCPMCGSKFTANQADLLKRNKTVTCEYCGTSVG
jgi:tetratricopeptide (TPR) repeat protein